MIYKNFKDLKLSRLGLGTMRLPLNENGLIDEEETYKMIDYALKNGINYFDTAYKYHDGESEKVVGKILKQYPREDYYLATKFPGYDIALMSKVEEVFEEQLKKCQVDYFDFYLFHNVYEKNIDLYLDEKYGILAYLLKQKENGRIKHLGFSVHGSYDVTKRFLEAYGQHMEFCQIQLNYLDYEFQDAKSKIELLNKYHIPVWVMEPLRGGKLAQISKKHQEKLNALRTEETVPGWAFRFLQSIPEVVVTLSGMSSMEQLQENIKTFEEEKPLEESEMKALLKIADEILEGNILPCTECRYCTSHCPKELNIPYLLSLYNDYNFTGKGVIATMKNSAIPKEKRASACIGCKSCEAVCPQQLKIAEAMSNFANSLNEN